MNVLPAEVRLPRTFDATLLLEEVERVVSTTLSQTAGVAVADAAECLDRD